MKPIEADLDEFNNFVREVHRFQNKLSAEVRKGEDSIGDSGKSLVDKFDKFIKKLDKEVS